MAGFKKSLFGFNCADVLNYIDKSQKKNAEKEKKLKTEIENLNSQLETVKGLNLELSKKVDEFNAKYDEIERLSQNIGKLYLVAQTNAQAIIENSENSAKLISEEVKQNLTSIEEAHVSLSLLRSNIEKTSNDFISEVETLLQSLQNTKQKISNNEENISASKQEFVEVLESVTK